VPADVSSVSAGLSATFTSGGAPRVQSTPPLELRGPFRETDGLPLFLLRNVTAGVFAGDRYDVRLACGPGARVRVSTPSAAKVYAMPHGHAESHLTIEAGERSVVSYAPAPTILQAGCDYRQTTAVTIAAGAVALVREVVSFGRLASGERLAFRRFRSGVSITRVGASSPAYIERYTLAPADAGPQIDYALRGSGVLGTLIAAGVDAAGLIGPLRTRFDKLGCQAGITALPHGAGLVLKVLAERADFSLGALHAAESAILEIVAAG